MRRVKRVVLEGEEYDSRKDKASKEGEDAYCGEFLLFGRADIVAFKAQISSRRKCSHNQNKCCYT